jgi:hypothetical protein
VVILALTDGGDTCRALHAGIGGSDPPGDAQHDPLFIDNLVQLFTRSTTSNMDRMK